jgi:hypothetical protein
VDDVVAVVPVDVVVGSGNEDVLVMVGKDGGEDKSVVEVKEKGGTSTAWPWPW